MFTNPQAEVHWDDPLAQRVQKVIDDRIAPSLAGHGGWVELVGVEGETATIQFGGGCQVCVMSQVSLKDGIEAAILEEVPVIKQVLDETDHDSGAIPYYSIYIYIGDTVLPCALCSSGSCFALRDTP